MKEREGFQLGHLSLGRPPLAAGTVWIDGREVLFKTLAKPRRESFEPVVRLQMAGKPANRNVLQGVSERFCVERREARSGFSRSLS